MFFHVYLTDGFVYWTKLLLQSFKRYHGIEIPFVLSTRNLSKKQINELKKIYKNVYIHNQELNFNDMSRRTGKTIKELKQYKYNVEYLNSKTKGFTLWKQLISVEDRYRNSIIEAMNLYKDQDYMIHIDSDMFIRSDLTDLFTLVRNNDVTINFRLKEKLHRKVFGNLIGFALNDKTQLFMEVWKRHIDKLDIKDKPKNYGQTSFYYTYKELEHSGIKWGNIPTYYVGRKNEKKSLIWSGNSNGSMGKKLNYKMCMEDFNEKK